MAYILTSCFCNDACCLTESSPVESPRLERDAFIVMLRVYKHYSPIFEFINIMTYFLTDTGMHK